MYRTELNIGGLVFEVTKTDGDKQVSRSLGSFHSKILRFISVARSSVFPERVRVCSVVGTLMNWDITAAVLCIQYL